MSRLTAGMRAADARAPAVRSPVPHRLVTVVALAVAVALAAVAVGQRAAPIRGTPGDDRLIGTPGPDAIHGVGGADLLVGAGGPDVLMGNSGADDLRGGAGADTLLGGPGADRLAGGPGDDVLQAGADRNRDHLVCGPGEDTASGAAPDVVGPDCELLRLALPQGSAPTPVTVEFLGWASLARPREPGVVTAVPPDAVPSGGTLTACPATDRRVTAYFRMHGITRPTATRTVLLFPAGPVVDLNSVRVRDEGDLFLYNFVGGPQGGPGRVENGIHTIRFQVAAAGAYTTVAEATVTRACA